MTKKKIKYLLKLGLKIILGIVILWLIIKSFSTTAIEVNTDGMFDWFSIWYVVILIVLFLVGRWIYLSIKKKENNNVKEGEVKIDKERGESIWSKLFGWIFIKIPIILLVLYLLFNSEMIVERVTNKVWASDTKKWSSDIKLIEKDFFGNQRKYRVDLVCDKEESIEVACFAQGTNPIATVTISYGKQYPDFPPSAYYKIRSVSGKSCYIDVNKTERF